MCILQLTNVKILRFISVPPFRLPHFLLVLGLQLVEQHHFHLGPPTQHLNLEVFKLELAIHPLLALEQQHKQLQLLASPVLL